MLLTICSQPELRSALSQRAGHYFPDEDRQNLLIDRTISAVCNDPNLVDSNSVQNALFKVMHHLAQPGLPAFDLSDDRTFAAA